MSLVFFFKQEAAYEMRMSDWSSDVCSSDLTSVKRAPVAERTKSGKGVPQSSIQCIGTPENQWRRASFARASEAGLPAANLWRSRSFIAAIARTGTPATRTVILLLLEIWLAAPSGADRKSTRLNSSH